MKTLGFDYYTGFTNWALGAPFAYYKGMVIRTTISGFDDRWQWYDAVDGSPRYPLCEVVVN